MNNLIERKWCTKGTVYIEDLTGTAFTGEDGGHTFIISGVNPDGTSVTLAGTVAGAYILPDGSTQPLTGSIADGKAQVTLDPECYALPGRGQLTIFLTSNGQKVAIYGAVLNVARSSTGQVPPAITADVADLVNDIEEARATIPASYTNLMSGLAKNYEDLTFPIKAGAYAWHAGTLYKAKTDISAAESWTAAHWETVHAANDLAAGLSSLKSALTHIENDGTARLDSTNFVNGSLNMNTGAIINGYNYRATSLNNIVYSRDISIVPASGYRFYVLYMSGNTVSQQVGWQTAVYTIPKNQEFKLLIAKITEDTSSVADINTFVNALVVTSFVSDMKDEIDKEHSEINQIETDGTTRLDPSVYVNGSLNVNTGGITNGYDYRVTAKEYVTYDRPVTISLSAGYRTYFLFFSGDTITSNSGWVTDKVDIPANQKFKNVIAKITEDTSSVADINTFVNALIVSTVISDMKSAVDSLEMVKDVSKASYPNVFDRTNTSLILADKTINSSGDVSNSSGFSVIKIPVNGIDGNAYNVYMPNSSGTGFVPASTRFAMYDGSGTKIAILVNGSETPAIVNNAECRYLYTAVSSAAIASGRVMILTNTGGAILQIWDIVPYGEHNISDLQWKGKGWASYGDSISAINNGNFLGKGWAKYVNYEYGFAKFFGRSVGGQTFKWGTGGGAVTFVSEEDGQYVNRNGDYNLDNYTGTVPSGCIAVRGCMCSWLKIKSMFPTSIKNDIDMVFIMAGSNDIYTPDETLTWLENDTTDPEWALSDEYSNYGGDYNIATTIGAVASTLMKFQAWLPNAIIVFGTPLNGNTETNPSTIRPDYIPDELYKGRYIKTVAEIYGTPCIDVFGTCGINMLNAPTYITDSVHPYCLDGIKMLGRAVVGGLKTIYPKY